MIVDTIVAGIPSLAAIVIMITIAGLIVHTSITNKTNMSMIVAHIAHIYDDDSLCDLAIDSD